jgi:hypothetical protein
MNGLGAIGGGQLQPPDEGPMPIGGDFKAQMGRVEYPDLNISQLFRDAEAALSRTDLPADARARILELRQQVMPQGPGGFNLSAAMRLDQFLKTVS